MGRFIDDGENHFRIEYRTPLGGVDSKAPPQFIEGNRLVSASNGFIREEQYTPITPQLVPWTGAGTYNPLNDFVGIGELPFIGISGGVYNSSGYFFITATYAGGNATITAWQAGDLQGAVPINIGSVTLPVYQTLGRLTYITINQVVYLSAPGLTGICQLAIIPSSPTFQFQMTLLTSNLGCSYLREMSGRLVAMNVWQVVSSIVTNFPYQIAWSAAGQQYGVWNVLDASGNPTGAGFNNLPDVEDIITGAQFTGPTAYIYRQQGITEVTGLNSGVQPFDFNHLWASEKGIGAVYSNSLDQYGTESAFVSDTDVFSFGIGGLAPISGPVRQGIYETLVASSNNLFGLLCGITFDGEPELYYILIFQPLTAVGGQFQTVFWIYDYTDKEWMMALLNFAVFTPIQDARKMQKQLTDGATNANLAAGILPVFVFQATNSVPVLYYFPDPSNSSTTAMQLVFPVELIAPFRDVTIDGIVIWTAQTDGSQITPSINGINYQTITADGVSNQSSGGYYKSYPADESAAKTFQNPQLTLNVTGTAQIGHIILYGTQVSTERPV